MKVSIIGGGGRVGASAAFALQQGGIVREIALVDVARDLADGEALDLRHGAAFSASQVFTSGDMSAVRDSDVVIVTAGLRRKPDESRLDLINRNAALFRSILDDIDTVRLQRGWILFVVANPVDILTFIASETWRSMGGRVIGLGTMLDTLRLRSLIGDRLGIDPTQVNALVLGEHGDSQVPVWSSATVNGVPLGAFAGWTRDAPAELAEQTKTSGADVIRLKGGAGYAVGVAIREVIEAIALDRRSVLPICTRISGAYGLTDVALSVPTIVGRAGALEVIEMPLSADERQALRESARVLKETIAGLR
jgi:L-lactate dehydrogenase